MRQASQTGKASLDDTNLGEDCAKIGIPSRRAGLPLVNAAFCRSISLSSSGGEARGEEAFYSVARPSHSRPITNSRGLRRPQANRMSNVIKLCAVDLLEAFAGRGKLFVDLDRFLRHGLVSFLRASQQNEIV